MGQSLACALEHVFYPPVYKGMLYMTTGRALIICFE
jgi:hypothetical protein